MQLNKSQYIIIGAAIIAFFVMYFGCETKPKNVKDLEKSRSLNMQVTSIQNIILEARKSLKPDQISVIERIQSELDRDTANKIETLEMLSSKWYELGFPVISGHYAEEIATKKNTEEAWSIAGTTYSLGLKSVKSEKEKDFSREKAILSFEKAISLNPSNVNHRINTAICYVEHPPKDNVMAGIMMLRDLNTKYPENVNVLNQLARLALKTNQIDRAFERLNQAIKLEDKNKTTICLLAEAYEAKGDIANAELYKKQCLN
jgi:tetratricopeptide (TPR) repeat protein